MPKGDAMTIPEPRRWAFTAGVAIVSAGAGAVSALSWTRRRPTVERAEEAQVEASDAELGTDDARRHDLANAMTAVEGAGMLLGPDGGHLSDADREQLGSVLAMGIRRLRELVAELPDPESGQPEG